MDRMDATNCQVGGHLYFPIVMALFRDRKFDHLLEAAWEKLLITESKTINCGLRQAWSNLHNSFLAVAIV